MFLYKILPTFCSCKPRKMIGIQIIWRMLGLIFCCHLMKCLFHSNRCILKGETIINVQFIFFDSIRFVQFVCNLHIRKYNATYVYHYYHLTCRYVRKLIFRSLCRSPWNLRALLNHCDISRLTGWMSRMWPLVWETCYSVLS